MIPIQTIYAFEANLRRFGKTAEVSRYKLNYIGEPTDSLEPLTTLRGIHHLTTISVKSLKTADSAVYNSVKQNMLMCLFQDAKEVAPGDILTLGGTTFKVSAVQDVYGDKAIIDISLEEFQTSPTLTGEASE